jgi:C1A family cysteine protease
MGRLIKNHLLLVLTIATFSFLLNATVLIARTLNEVQETIQKKGAQWIAGDTSVSKLPDYEKKLRLGAIRPALTGSERILLLEAPPTGLPTVLDWRSNGGNYVTPVRDQGACSSCWAFATTAALESYILIKDNLQGVDDNRAEEILLSCSMAGSCHGGDIHRAADYIRYTGLPPDSYFPYTASSADDSCSNALIGWENNTYNIPSWSWVNTWSVSVDAIKNALYSHSPLVTIMTVCDDFFSYVDGIYENTTESCEDLHAVLIVGYKDDLSVGGGGYFIAKNSWGDSWGQGGYFNIAYSQTTSPVYFGRYTIAYEHVTPWVRNALIVNIDGSGTGRVTSIPSGIDCEPTCMGTYIVGTEILLTAHPDRGSEFAYWSGGCTGTAETCSLIIADYIDVTAHFVPYGTKEYKLNVKKARKNKGDGTVMSTDGNINCGDACSYTYYGGTTVTLSASANQGSTFIGWSPETPTCTGTGSCIVTIDKAKTVQAIFVGDYALKVTAQSKKGGSGLVSSTPSGISCSPGSKVGCTAPYPYNEQVALSASPNAGSTFLGWSPAKLCPGTGVCIAPMDKKRSVKAVFSR